MAAVMVGFNSVNGTNMHHHKKLVQGLLKDELGFGGVVMTDWDGGTRYGPPYMAINAGVDVFMQPVNIDDFFFQSEPYVANNIVPMSRIDDAVRRILQMKFKLGLFARPRERSWPTKPAPPCIEPWHGRPCANPWCC